MNLERFLAECASLLGHERTLDAAAAQAAFGRNTLAIRRRIAGALRPLDVDEIKQIVMVARRFEVDLYPLSTGHNWGYGGAVPHREDSIIVDLSGMNRIVAFDAELGIVTLEPGVTTGQLYDFLQSRALPYMVPVTGAGPTNSLIGNALERGFGLVPHTDHFHAIKALKAVLADGRVYQSVLAELPEGDADRVHKWGVGPYVDGLFAQGNFGIVTEASIALAPLPEETAILLMGCDDDDPSRCIDFMLAVMHRYASNVGCIQLSNRTRFQNSRAEAGGPPAHAWNLFASLYGDRAVVSHVAARLKRHGKAAFARHRCLPYRLVRRLGTLHARLPRRLRESHLGRQIALASEFSEFVRGKPIDSALRNFAYLGQGRPLPDGVLNPDRDACGILWYAPLVPLRARSVRDFIDIATPIVSAHGFEFSLALSTLSAHCLDATIALQFDASDPQASARAHACYRQLFEAGRQRGFLPYRVGLQGMDMLVDDSHVFWQVIRQLKDALDPSGTLSPGRYSTTIADRVRSP